MVTDTHGYAKPFRVSQDAILDAFGTSMCRQSACISENPTGTNRDHLRSRFRSQFEKIKSGGTVDIHKHTKPVIVRWEMIFDMFATSTVPVELLCLT